MSRICFKNFAFCLILEEGPGPTATPPCSSLLRSAVPRVFRFYMARSGSLKSNVAMKYFTETNYLEGRNGNRDARVRLSKAYNVHLAVSVLMTAILHIWRLISLQMSRE